MRVCHWKQNKCALLQKVLLIVYRNISICTKSISLLSLKTFEGPYTHFLYTSNIYTAQRFVVILECVKSFFCCTKSLCFDEGHPMCPHVSIKLPLCFKHLAAHFTFRIRRPVFVLVSNIQLVFSLTLFVLFAPPVVPAQTLRLLQPMDDEEMPGQRAVGCVAQAALLTLIRGAVGLVLWDVFVESSDVLSGEAADGTFVKFDDVHLQPLQRLQPGAPGGQTR